VSGPLVPFIIGYLAGKASGGVQFHLFGSKSRGGGAAFPASTHAIEVPHAIPAAYRPVATSTAVPMGGAPKGLPWPSAWHAKSPPSSADVTRAWALMGSMKPGQVHYEHGGEGWLAFYCYIDRGTGKKFVSVYEPRAQASAQRVSV